MPVATDYKMPVFGEAVRQFTGFLVSQGLSPGLLWVFPEDVCWRKQRLFVKEGMCKCFLADSLV
jgi:hypothetical protein